VYTHAANHSDELDVFFGALDDNGFGVADRVEQVDGVDMGGAECFGHRHGAALPFGAFDAPLAVEVIGGDLAGAEGLCGELGDDVGVDPRRGAP
jgi:hypothetical protein